MIGSRISARALRRCACHPRVSARSPRRHLHAGVDAPAPCRGRHRAAHRVHERREPVARPRVGAAARCGRACGTRRQSRSTRTTRADREPRRVADGNHRRYRPCLALCARAGVSFARKPCPCRRDRHRRARARGCRRCRTGDRTRLRHRSRAARIQSRVRDCAQRERPWRRDC